MSNDADYLAIALEEAALAAQEGEIPVGAVIVKDGRILSRAHNRRENDRSALAHAEILCISEACRKLDTWRLGGCTLYVTLEPCPMCAGAILNARLDRVVFALPDARAGCFGSVLQMNAYPFNHRVALAHGEEEQAAMSSDMMRRFFAARRQKSDT